MYSHLQKLKTGHDFQAFLCWDMRLFNFMFYCIIQFGLKTIRKERGRFREHVREKTTQTTNTTKQKQKSWGYH